MCEIINVSAEKNNQLNIKIKETSENKNKISHEISNLLRLVKSKFNEYNSQTSKELQNALDEIKRLQNIVNILKNKPCSKCVKLLDITEFLKKRLKEREDTVSVIGKLLLNRNPNSYTLASQMVNDVITNSASEITYFENEPISAEEKLNEINDTIKSEKVKKSIGEVSPIVLKKSRSKRKFMNISSKKKK